MMNTKNDKNSIKEFPTAFDLFWDVKDKSQLKDILQSRIRDVVSMIDMIDDEGLDLWQFMGGELLKDGRRVFNYTRPLDVKRKFTEMIELAKENYDLIWYQYSFQLGNETELKETLYTPWELEEKLTDEWYEYFSGESSTVNLYPVSTKYVLNKMRVECKKHDRKLNDLEKRVSGSPWLTNDNQS